MGSGRWSQILITNKLQPLIGQISAVPPKNPRKKCVDEHLLPQKNPQRRNGLDWHGLQRCGIISRFRNVVKKATSTQTFRIVRNTGTLDLYGFRRFVALWRQI